MSKANDDAASDLNEFMEFFMSPPYFSAHQRKPTNCEVQPLVCNQEITQDSGGRSASTPITDIPNSPLSANRLSFESATGMDNVTAEGARNGQQTGINQRCSADSNIPPVSDSSNYAEYENQKHPSSVDVPPSVMGNGIIVDFQRGSNHLPDSSGYTTPIPDKWNILTSQLPKNLSADRVAPITNKGSTIANYATKESLLSGTPSIDSTIQVPFPSMHLQFSAPPCQPESSTFGVDCDTQEDAQILPTNSNKKQSGEAQMSFTKSSNVKLTSAGCFGTVKSFGDGLQPISDRVGPNESAITLQSSNERTDEPEHSNAQANNQSIGKPAESARFFPGPSRFSSHFPVVYTIPVPEFPLAPAVVPPTFNNSGTAMPSLMQTSVGWLSLMPRPKLLPYAPRLLNSQSQPLNLSRELCASLAAPFPSPTTPFGEISPNNSSSISQPIRTDTTIGNIDERTNSTDVAKKSTNEDSINRTQPSKHSELRIATVKCKDAPNITVRVLSPEMNFVRRNITAQSKRGEGMPNRNRMSSASTSTSLPSSSPKDSEITLLEEENVGGKRLRRAIDSNSKEGNNHNVLNADHTDNNNNAANSDEGTIRKKRRPRLNDSQKLILEENFELGRYPSIGTIITISKTIGLGVADVRKWFANRRRKERDHVKRQHEALWPSIGPSSSESNNWNSKRPLKKIIIE